MIKLRVTRYKLISHEYELRTSYFYCTSYELLFAYELRVTVYYTSYEVYFKKCSNHVLLVKNIDKDFSDVNILITKDHSSLNYKP